MDKRAAIKKIVSAGKSENTTRTDTPWWGVFSRNMGAMGKTPADQKKNKLQRTMELLDLGKENYMRGLDNEYRQSSPKRTV